MAYDFSNNGTKFTVTKGMVCYSYKNLKGSRVVCEDWQ